MSKKFFKDEEIRQDIIGINLDTGIAIMKDGSFKYIPRKQKVL